MGKAYYVETKLGWVGGSVWDLLDKNAFTVLQSLGNIKWFSFGRCAKRCLVEQPLPLQCESTIKENRS